MRRSGLVVRALGSYSVAKCFGQVGRVSGPARGGGRYLCRTGRRRSCGLTSECSERVAEDGGSGAEGDERDERCCKKRFRF